VTTTPATTVPAPTCPPLDGVGVDPKQGDAAPGTAPATPLLTGVQVEASDCVDVVLFEFANGTPSWSAAIEGSGSGANEPVLVLRFTSETATSPSPPPSEIRPEVPRSFVLVVFEVPQADGSRAWSVGISSQGDRRPFRVVVREGALAIEVATRDAPRAVSCTDADQPVQFDVPVGWFVDVTPAEQPCTRFAPEPFSVCSACDGPFPYGLVRLSAEAITSDPQFETVVSSTETMVRGRPATVSEVEATGDGLFPAGYRTYKYVVDWSPSGWLVMSIDGHPGLDLDARKAGLDAIASSARYVG
jgi:hypothetical protein